MKELLFGDGVAHSIFVLALVIAAGVALGKVKVRGISIGTAWILFVGIAVSHFGMGIDSEILLFAKEFGLILFVYSIGMQVGPGFFSSFRKGGMRLNGYALMIVALGVGTACGVCRIFGIAPTTMVGILSGAVTNTPGLGAAQQAYIDATGVTDESIAMGYAVAYPLGVLGVLASMILLRYLFRVNVDAEDRRSQRVFLQEDQTTGSVSVRLRNPMLAGKSLREIRRLIDRNFVVSRILHPDGHVSLADGRTSISEGDVLYVVVSAKDEASVVAFLGEKVTVDPGIWNRSNELVSRRIVITRTEINGRHLGELRLRSTFGVNVTRVNRAGVDLVANSQLQLQMGDRLTVVGTEMSLEKVSHMLGNSMKRLREPNLIPLFVGILLGVALGSLPVRFGSITQPVKLGLAGGPLIVAILMSRFGPRYHLVTYTTMSANLMLREIGIALFLATVGLGAGEGFVDTVIHQGGYRWIGYGFLITVIPIFITAFVARKWGRLDYFSLLGVISGGMTNPVALSFASAVSPNDRPAVSYATVYPLTMFLRVMTAQVLILLSV